MSNPVGALERSPDTRVNLAVFLILILPLAALVMTSIRAASGTPPEFREIAEVTLSAAVIVSAALPAAARLRVAPWACPLLCATSLSVVYVLTRLEYPPEEVNPGWAADRAFAHMMLNFWVQLIACVLIWISRSAFTRAWDLRQFPWWCLRGLKGLLRTDRWAGIRFLAGAAVVTVAVLLYFVAGAGLSGDGRRALGRVSAGILFGGAVLMASCFRVGLADPPGEA